ncbi:hypothetical protein EVAR_103201_1 [Eumeta japonica]|uniref:Uncharacterized protein n=1 Tax=Eumeta variegata TaxID=151549 RepID=A0A4C1YCK1_EUMVA|nr:hypothetical protein EVAR_103201_1 [Eumeta japonica]
MRDKDGLMFNVPYCERDGVSCCRSQTELKSDCYHPCTGALSYFLGSVGRTLSRPRRPSADRPTLTNNTDRRHRRGHNTAPME